MKWLKVEYIKQHSRLDYDCEDALIELYASAAEDAILAICRRTYENVIDEFGSVPTTIVEASLLLTDHLYENRTVASQNNISPVPYTFDLMVKEYVVLAGGKPIEVERNYLLKKLCETQQDFIFGYDEIENKTEELANAFAAEMERIADIYKRYSGYNPTTTICQALRQMVAKVKEECTEILNVD